MTLLCFFFLTFKTDLFCFFMQLRDLFKWTMSLWLIFNCFNKWAPSSEFVSSSIPSWQILTAHAQLFRGARDLVFCLKVPLDSLLVWASSGGSGETARMRRLAWTFAARIGDKYQIRLTRSKYTRVDKNYADWCCMVQTGRYPIMKFLWQRRAIFRLLSLKFSSI